METLTAKVEYIRFKASNGWTVASIITNDGMPACVVGPMDIRQGSKFIFSGKWVTDPKFGEQFKVVSADLPLPDDYAGALGFLEQLPHIGVIRGEELLSKFGTTKLFDMIKENPNELSTVVGITVERATEICNEYGRIMGYKEEIIFLKSFELSDLQCTKIRVYAQETKQRIQTIFETNPYQLTKISSFGFLTVDDIAIRYGTPLDDLSRATEAIVFALEEAKTQGHCFMLYPDVLEWIDSVYVPKETGGRALDALIEEGTRVILANNVIYLHYLFHHEVDVAYCIAELSDTSEVDLDEALKEEYDDTVKNVLHFRQIDAVETALINSVSIITGGPGTGKTTSLRKVIEALRKLGVDKTSIACCAPTGKAAIRMKQQTGTLASTIHRLLRYDQETGGFLHNQSNPLLVNTVIVDEASMVDIQLMNCLIAATPTTARLILVGDVDQLPPVGPGDVLGDLIRTDKIPTTRLTHIFRQSEHSWISINARDIRDGRNPNIDDKHSEDFFFIDCDDCEDIQDTLITLVQSTIPSRHNIPASDIQLLCPQKKRSIGIEEMNEIFQDTFNPSSPNKKEWYMGTEKTIRVGDRVIHTVNNYTLMVMNGEVGIVDSISKVGKEEKMAVNFGDQTVLYSRADAFHLQLAYALTVHKSQGSEYPAVIMPVHSINSFMLTRKLIYTAITRGKKAVYLVGEREALFKGIKNNKDDVRNTMLTERVKRALEEV